MHTTLSLLGEWFLVSFCMYKENRSEYFASGFGPACEDAVNWSAFISRAVFFFFFFFPFAFFSFLPEGMIGASLPVTVRYTEKLYGQNVKDFRENAVKHGGGR